MKLPKDESPEDCGYGEPAPLLPLPPLPPGERRLSPWWVVAVLAFVVAFMVSALSGCAGTQVGDAVSEYRENHEAVVAFELRGGLAWIGFGVRKVGRAAEIEVIEGEKPYSAKSGL